ncbi:MAG: ATP synthase F1 subunit epsilon [Verrucomicrobiae bacterium]|nr:ATP synthase F1 subunit epsilon [Verrucomicrobiae bacterium]
MPEKTFQLEILTPQRIAFRAPVRFVIAQGTEGVFEVLPGHAPFVFALHPGPLRVRTPDGRDQHWAVGGGFLWVDGNTVTVLAHSAERPEEIDTTRAEQARRRAEWRLQHPQGVDMPRAKAALQRALARLKVAAYVERGT